MIDENIVLQDAALTIRNINAFYRAVELFPNYFLEILGQEGGIALYETAIVWRELSNEKRKIALKNAKENTNAASTVQGTAS